MSSCIQGWVENHLKGTDLADPLQAFRKLYKCAFCWLVLNEHSLTLQVSWFLQGFRYFTVKMQMMI